MAIHDFRGAAKRIDDIDLPKLGHLLGVGEDEIHAFIEAETRGSGFDPQDRPKILFERHKFYKYVPREKRDAAVKAGLASPKAGGYGKESVQYEKLMRAIAIDREAALLSCSWGLAQVMGFNHKLAGYDTVEAMVEAFMADEENHLLAAVNFILACKLDDELREHNWAGFAKGYNGPNYRINKYDEKLADAYAKWAKIRDTPWSPGQLVVDGSITAKPAPVQPEHSDPVPAQSAKSEPEPVGVPSAGIGAALVAVLAAGAAYLANLPCDVLGVFCGG